MINHTVSICLLPQKIERGGGASFQARFIEKLISRNIDIQSSPENADCKCILINGGTRHLDRLWLAKRRGVRIVQRLDGFNWIHRKRWTGVNHFFRSEINNGILAIIRRYFADAIIYQSQYVRKRWDQVFGEVNAECSVIYNGVDLNSFSPSNIDERPKTHTRLLVVEGSLRGGHELGLDNAINLANEMQKLYKHPIELTIAADVDEKLLGIWKNQPQLWITWYGFVPREQIITLDRSAHLLFSAEINAPCPNSVIEALACGLPVISYDTGSLPELVSQQAGKLVSYGGNYDRLGPPDVNSLARAALDMLTDLCRYQRGARKRAVEKFDINKITDSYLQVLY